MRTRAIVQLSTRGQVTLPADARSALGLEPGDPLVVLIEEGRIVLAPVVVTPLEIYDPVRLAEFEAAARLTPDELAEARRRWAI